MREITEQNYKGCYMIDRLHATSRKNWIKNDWLNRLVNQSLKSYKNQKLK